MSNLTNRELLTKYDTLAEEVRTKFFELSQFIDTPEFQAMLAQHNSEKPLTDSDEQLDIGHVYASGESLELNLREFFGIC